MLRELIKIGGNLYSKGYDEMTDPFELVESTEKALHDLTLTLNSKDCISIDDTLIEIVKELEEKRNRDEYLTGISTGFASLDRHTCGWQPTDFNIFAARPKSGKTAFALNLAVNALLSGSGVCFFSMEMSARQLVKRILANKANMYLQALRDARLDDGQMSHLFEKGIKKLHGLPFYIDDTASLSVAEFKAKARRLIRKDGVKMLIIDYLQLMQPDRSKKGQNREQEISTIARQLKITAKELSVPIIALSQLSREVEKRGSHVPQLSDLRESGSLEQDADMVGFLYRPTEQEILEDAGKAETIYFKIAAYRNGDNKTIEYNFKGEYQRFEEVGEYTAKEAPVRAIKPKEDTFPGTRLYLHNRPTGTDDKDPF
jgi:replicative DNA helicase